MWSVMQRKVRDYFKVLNQSNKTPKLSIKKKFKNWQMEERKVIVLVWVFPYSFIKTGCLTDVRQCM